MDHLNRAAPALSPLAYQTFAIASPADRQIPAACEQVLCEQRQFGWESHIDESTELGKRQARYIRTQSGRTFREAKSGTITVFKFASGQRCFREHHTRPEVFYVHGGDWRQQTSAARQHTRAADWVEDFGLNQIRLRDARARG